MQAKTNIMKNEAKLFGLKVYVKKTYFMDINGMCEKTLSKTITIY